MGMEKLNEKLRDQLIRIEEAKQLPGMNDQELEHENKKCRLQKQYVDMIVAIGNGNEDNQEINGIRIVSPHEILKLVQK